VNSSIHADGKNKKRDLPLQSGLIVLLNCFGIRNLKNKQKNIKMVRLYLLGVILNRFAFTFLIWFALNNLKKPCLTTHKLVFLLFRANFL